MNIEENFPYLDEETKKLIEREVQHFWKHKYQGDGMDDIFDLITKDDLIVIKRNLMMPVPSNLKKTEMLDQIKMIYLFHLKFHLTYLTTSQVDFIESIINSDGKLLFEPIHYREIFYLRSLGIAFPMVMDDKQYVIMPTETREMLKNELKKSELIQIIKLNSEIIQATCGLLYYYGVISYEKLIPIIQSYYPKDTIEYQHIRAVLSIYRDSQEYISQYGNYLYLSGYEEDDITDILDERYKHPLDYFPINKIRALQASDPMYLEQTPQLKQLINYINQIYNVNKNDLEDFIYELVDSIKLGQSIKHYIEIIQKYFEFGNLTESQKFIHLIQELHNHTRMWVLKGHMPAELSKTDPVNQSKSTPIIKQVQVSRNDNCPCGSGKKYKHCCINKG